MDVCTTSAPGQQECDNALRQIQAMRPLLENPTEPVSEQAYFASLDGVMERARVLAQTMMGISGHAKSGELHSFCDDVHDFAGAVCGITANAAQVRRLRTCRHAVASASTCTLHVYLHSVRCVYLVYSND